MPIYVGVDISKKTLDFSWEEMGTRYHKQVKNSEIGFKEMVKKVPKNSFFVMEATGAYYLRFAFFLYENKHRLAVVNPLVIKRYAQMELKRTKTDKADGQLISEFAQFKQPLEWEVPDVELLKIQNLWAYSDSLVKQRGMLENQIEAFTQNPFGQLFLMQSIKSIISSIDNELKKVEKQMYQLASRIFPRELEIIKSIPGIGLKTTIALLVIGKGFGDFDNGKAFCSFIGLTPQITQSGTSINKKAGITKIGNSRIRSMLYMCSLSAIKTNLGCKQMYERMIENGKIPKVALVAVMAKLARQAVTLVKRDTFFDQKMSLSTCN